ncbi:MAG: molybdopterin cofactor-binding domain-containing protein [Acidimicrobiales bacterium]
MGAPLRGTPVVRREDEHLLRGQGEFVANRRLPGMAHVRYVVSTMAHARIVSIDVSEAAECEGVVGVVTAADLDLGDYPATSPAFDQAMVRPLLARDRVRFVGEPVVAIVAETPEAARDAAESVFIDYEPLPVVIDPERSLEGDVVLFDDTAEGNVVIRMDSGDLQADFSQCEVVVDVRTINNRLAPAALEPRVAMATWAEDGRLHHFNAGQGVHPVRAGLAAGLGLEQDQLRVVSADVGGSFGAKGRPHPEEVLLGWLSKRFGRPIMWFPDRSDDMTGLGHGRGQVQTCRIGGSRDGDIQAYHLHILQDAGAYPAGGAGLPNNGRAMLTGCYDIASVGFSAASVVTNTTPVGAYRGAGRPEAAAAIERAVDAFAAEIGMDPAEVRRKNFLARDAFPWRRQPARRTTLVTTRAASTPPFRPVGTHSCAPNRPGAEPPKTNPGWASGWPPMSSAPQAPAGPSGVL